MPPSTTPGHPRRDLSEDRPLLELFRAGDHSALERVFRQYLPLVLHFVIRGVVLEGGGKAFVQQQPEQDDLVQEVFLRLFSPAMRQRYDGIRPFAAWVRTVARNVVVDHLRKVGRSAATLGAMTEWDLERLAPAGPPAPDEVALSREESAVVDSFVASLEPDEATLVRLRFELLASQEEAARQLGKSRQNVRTMELGIKARLAALLRGRR